MTDSIVLKAAVNLVDQLQSENDAMHKRIGILEDLYFAELNYASMFRHMTLLSNSALSMICFEHAQGSGTLEELVKISMGKK